MKAHEIRSEQPEGWELFSKILLKHLGIQLPDHYRFPTGCGSLWMMKQLKQEVLTDVLETDALEWFVKMHTSNSNYGNPSLRAMRISNDRT